MFTLYKYILLHLRSSRDCGSSCRSRLWYFLSPVDGTSVREAHCAQACTAVRRTEAPCAQASTAVRFSARSALRAGYWPTCLTDGHMVVNDHTRSAEKWKCVWYFLRPIDGSSSAAARLFTDWRAHLPITTTLIGRCARERCVLLQSPSMVSCRRHYPSDNANGTSTLLNIYTSDRQYNYNIHCYSFIRESTHIIAHTNRVYVDSHSLTRVNAQLVFK